MTRWRQSFLTGLLLRMAAVVTLSYALSAALGTPGLLAVPLVAGLLLAASIFELWRYIRRTNRALTRFLEAVRFADTSQSFAALGRDSGFEELGSALDEAVGSMRRERTRANEELRFMSAVLDDAPAPLLSVQGDYVEPLNKAARRLFAEVHAGPPENFEVYGASFARCLTDLAPGEPRLVVLRMGGVRQSAMMSAATVHRLQGTVRILSVQPVQGMLDSVELAAQSDLVRVLTHEIMNSMTPVTSLAQTASDMMKRLDTDARPDLKEAAMAVDALARRASSVMSFVESYRTFASAPTLNLREVIVGPWLESLVQVHRASDAGIEVPLHFDPPSSRLTMQADPDYMGQVILNLLRNAAQATRQHGGTPETWLRVRRTREGRVALQVDDNGPGIAKTVRREVFLPFFTTKKEGSGIGLSLARQIVLAHGGSIEIDDSEHGGASVRSVI